MKYLWLKSKVEIKDKILVYYMIYLLFVILYILLNISTIKYFDIEDYSKIIGLNSLNNHYILDQILQILSYLIIIYFSTKMFINGITQNIEYVMIRISKKKWIIYEIINFIFYIIIMRVVLNVIIGFSFLLFNSNIVLNDIVILFFKDILFYMNLSLLTILTLNLFCLKGRNKILFIIPIILIIITIFINIAKINLIYIFIFFIIIILFNIFAFSPSTIYNKYKK